MRIGMLLFNRLTQLDLTGPFEVFGSVPECEIALMAATAAPVRSDRGLRIVPTHTFTQLRAVDLLFIPGGPGTTALLHDLPALRYLRALAAQAQYITSVCTGALVLGAAGLLRGRRATTHWNAHEFLAAFGALPVHERVVFDGKLVTGGGVTAGIDFALMLVAHLYGASVAQRITLGLEYDPAPPFDCGSPSRAAAQLVAAYQAQTESVQAERRIAVQNAALRLDHLNDA